MYKKDPILSRPILSRPNLSRPNLSRPNLSCPNLFSPVPSYANSHYVTKNKWVSLEDL